jgi:hypothetical protein
MPGVSPDESDDEQRRPGDSGPAQQQAGLPRKRSNLLRDQARTSTVPSAAPAPRTIAATVDDADRS